MKFVTVFLCACPQESRSDILRRGQECGSSLVNNEVKCLLVLCLGNLGCESYNSIVLSKLKTDVEAGGATGSRCHSVTEVHDRDHVQNKPLISLIRLFTSTSYSLSSLYIRPRL